MYTFIYSIYIYTHTHTHTHTDIYIYIHIYISIQYIYLFIYLFIIYFWYIKNLKRFPPYNFGTVHSDRTVVVLLHKHFWYGHSDRTVVVLLQKHFWYRSFRKDCGSLATETLLESVIQIGLWYSCYRNTFGISHSDRTVVVLIHKCFVFLPSPIVNFSSTITSFKYATMSRRNIKIYVTLL